MRSITLLISTFVFFATFLYFQNPKFSNYVLCGFSSPGFVGFRWIPGQVSQDMAHIIALF